MIKIFSVLLIVMALASLCIGQAQMQPNYTSYRSYDYDVSGYVYQTIQVTGSTTINCCWSIVCGPNNQMCYFCDQTCQSTSQTAKHWAEATHIWNGVKTTVASPQYAPTAYMSWSSTFKSPTPLAKNKDDQMGAEAQYKCTAAGILAGVNWIFQHFTLARTKVQFTGVGTIITVGKQCSVRAWCTPATTPPAANFTYVVDKSGICWNYYEAAAPCVRASVTDPWICTDLDLFGAKAYATTDPTPASCTYYK